MAVKYQDYYQALGVDRGASAKDIQNAFRGLARKYHPDVNKQPGAEQRFRQINEAYEVLKDTKKRQQYNALGADWKAGQDFRPPPGFENFHFEFRGGPEEARGFTFSSGASGAPGFSNFFESIFGRSSTGSGDARARDFGGFDTARVPQAHAHSEMTISLEEAFGGGTRRVRIEDDAGSAPRSLDVKIPQGIRDGAKMRLKGQGGQGRDLILKVNIAPHNRFTVQGDDLTVVVSISPWEAALGAKVQVETLDGTVALTIPPGTPSGRKLRLRGKGMPKRQRKQRGDLFAQCQIVVPQVLTDQESQLFQKLSEASTFDPRSGQ